jgi:shikimate kinase
MDFLTRRFQVLINERHVLGRIKPGDFVAAEIHNILLGEIRAGFARPCLTNRRPDTTRGKDIDGKVQGGKMNKYFLIGIPYSGKSTLGCRIAGQLQMPFFDIDVIAENRMGEVRLSDTLNPRFAMRFRDEQIKATLEFAHHSGSAVIATGAEVALIPECVELMKNIGYIIHIERDVEAILAELRETVDSRLVLTEINSGAILDFGKESVMSFSEDIPHYGAVADFCIDNNRSEDEGAEKLILLIQRHISSPPVRDSVKETVIPNSE